ncbi:16S rRNA (adenine(1518)-N(6)/adenine(1519)-N(6))-dimethyltransferase RsmA [bacterium]|nr:16S rRNA (adenine(1518)-N(6)/adenine(1519)-N(6))-dimethyltransferase RsmA [bacterium]
MPTNPENARNRKDFSDSSNTNKPSIDSDQEAPGADSDPFEEEPRALTAEEIELQLARLGMTGSPASVEDEEPLAAPIGYVRKHGGLPATKKSLGQNWLIDAEATRLMARYLGVGEGDLILEVGPGGGALTEALLLTGADILAVEIDARMIEVLENRWPNEPRLTLVHANILDCDIHELTGGRPCAVVGNLPYNITSNLLFQLMETALEHHGFIQKILVLLQLEVAQRLASPPGSSEYSVLSVLMRVFGEPEQVMTVPRDKFNPPPKVDAGVIQMELSGEPLYTVPHWPTFKRLVKGTFHKRRKMLRNSLPGIPNLAPWEDVDFDWSRRPQTLSAEEYAWLARQLTPKRLRKDSE